MSPFGGVQSTKAALFLFFFSSYILSIPRVIDPAYATFSAHISFDNRVFIG